MGETENLRKKVIHTFAAAPAVVVVAFAAADEEAAAAFIAAAAARRCDECLSADRGPAGIVVVMVDADDAEGCCPSPWSTLNRFVSASVLGWCLNKTNPHSVDPQAG